MAAPIDRQVLGTRVPTKGQQVGAAGLQVGRVLNSRIAPRFVKISVISVRGALRPRIQPKPGVHAEQIPPTVALHTPVKVGGRTVPATQLQTAAPVEQGVIEVQAPPAHEEPVPPHTIPQPPVAVQAAGLVGPGVTHAVVPLNAGQSVVVSGHAGSQSPPTQPTVPPAGAEQTELQFPQLEGSKEVLTHTPLQVARPGPLQVEGGGKEGQTEHVPLVVLQNPLQHCEKMEHGPPFCTQV